MLVTNTNKMPVYDFTIMGGVDSDDDNDFDPNDVKSEDVKDHVDSWDVVDIEDRVSCEPNPTHYNENNFLKIIEIEQMLEPGRYVSKDISFQEAIKR